MNCADLKSDAGPSLKTPPREQIRRRLVEPVGLEPVDDIEMAGDRHKSPVRRAHRMRDCRAPDLRDRPIYHARELVNRHKVMLFGKRPSNGDPKLLSR